MILYLIFPKCYCLVYPTFRNCSGSYSKAVTEARIFVKLCGDSKRIQIVQTHFHCPPVCNAIIFPDAHKGWRVVFCICNLRSSASAVAFLDGRLAEQNGHPFNADYLRLIITV